MRVKFNKLDLKKNFVYFNFVCLVSATWGSPPAIDKFQFKISTSRLIRTKLSKGFQLNLSCLEKSTEIAQNSTRIGETYVARNTKE